MSYFEVTLKQKDKDGKTFGIGLAGPDYPVSRCVGSKESIAIRGDGQLVLKDAVLQQVYM
jgi:hypothetical protein